MSTGYQYWKLKIAVLCYRLVQNYERKCWYNNLENTFVSGLHKLGDYKFDRSFSSATSFVFLSASPSFMDSHIVTTIYQVAHGMLANLKTNYYLLRKEKNCTFISKHSIAFTFGFTRNPFNCVIQICNLNYFSNIFDILLTAKLRSVIKLFLFHEHKMLSKNRRTLNTKLFLL